MMMLQPPALRPFQAEVVARARDANVVMVGATGIGKTFVAISLLSEQDYGGGKRAFVLAPTRQLVWQIAAKIRAGTTLRAGAYCGKSMEQWGAREWASEFAMTRVFVCTPEVLRNALERGLVRMTQLNLLVFDECHHVTKRHPYAHVMKMYDATRPDEMPRVFGTTATPTRHCAKNLHAEVVPVKLEKDETRAFAAVAPITLEAYAKEQSPPPVVGPVRNRIEGGVEEREDDEEETREPPGSALHGLQEILTELDVMQVLRKLLRKGKSDAARDDARLDKLLRKFFLSCVEIYRNLGVWCLYRFVELEIDRSAMNATLLLNIPGSMYGYDKEAVKLIMLARRYREECKFAATKRLEKVVELLEKRLVQEDESEASQASIEDESDSDDEDEEEALEHVGVFGRRSAVTVGDSDSLATTEDTDASLRDGDLGDTHTELNSIMEEDSADQPPRRLQGIIFVTTRAECRVVCEFLNERLADVGQRGDDDDESDEDDESNNESDSDENDEEEEEDPRFACILGQASSRDTAAFGLPKMEDTLAKFENGKIQFLVSTAVSVEGVDFPQCSLIIVASRIQAARKLIQLRGRARHQDGVVYYLHEEGDHEHTAHFRSMLEEAVAIEKFDFTADKEESVFQQPRSQASAQLVGFKFFPDESRLLIESTGAVLDLDSSIARLNMFCQTLPKQLCTVDLKNLYSYEQTTIQKRPLFSARVHLPDLPDVAELPELKSEKMHSKATAKAAAAFKACKTLYDFGLLDDSLNSVYRKAKPDDLTYLMRKINL